MSSQEGFCYRWLCLQLSLSSLYNHIPLPSSQNKQLLGRFALWERRGYFKGQETSVGFIEYLLCDKHRASIVSLNAPHSPREVNLNPLFEDAETKLSKVSCSRAHRW